MNKASNSRADKVYVGAASNSRGTINVGGNGNVELKCHLSLGAQLSGNGGKGYVNVSGNGYLLTTGDNFIGQTAGETGEFRQTGGIAQCNGVTRLCYEDSSSGLLDISGTGEYRSIGGVDIGANGKLNVRDGGRLVAKSVSTSKSTASVAFDGGTLVVTNVTDGANILSGLSNNITYGSGGLTLDTAGYNVTMATAIGICDAGSSFVKTGTGSLTMAALPPTDSVVVSNGTLALSASYNNASSASLTHRWSFTSDYSDSVGGATGTALGSALAIENGEVVLSGNGYNTGSLNLGKGLMPGTDATIEIWATRTANKNWSRIFDFGTSKTDYFTMTWVNGTDGSKDVVQLYKSNAAKFTSNNTMTYGSDKYHISVTFKANDNGSTTVSWARRNVTTGEVEKSGSNTASGWTLAELFVGDFYLGRSQYNTDADANAKYDEVRIWYGALSADALTLSAQKGPDASASDIADIVAATSAAAPAVRTLNIESGATLSIGAGSTLEQPVVSGGGTVSGGTLKVTNELLVNDLNDCIVVSGGVFDIDGAKVTFNAEDIASLATARKTYTLVKAVNGGTITGSLLQPDTDAQLLDQKGWHVTATSRSVKLSKSVMAIHIR